MTPLYLTRNFESLELCKQKHDFTVSELALHFNTNVHSVTELQCFARKWFKMKQRKQPKNLNLKKTTKNTYPKRTVRGVNMSEERFVQKCLYAVRRMCTTPSTDHKVCARPYKCTNCCTIKGCWPHDGVTFSLFDKKHSVAQITNVFRNGSNFINANP